MIANTLGILLLMLLLSGCSQTDTAVTNIKSTDGITTKGTATSKPNVILIYADDISARELAIYQSSKWSGFRGETVTAPDKLAEIPIIDRIANQGAFIETAWAATVCSPSRAMMMTGRHASLHKWWHNKDYGLIEEDGKQRPVRLYETSPLQIGHLAQNAGYKTIWVGKTQMGHATDHSVYGFDEGVFTPGIIYPEIAPHTTFGVLKKTVNGKRALYNNDTGKDIQGFSYVQQPWFWKPNVQLMHHPDAKSELEYWPNTPKTIDEYSVNTYGPDVQLDFIFDFMQRQHQSNKPFFVYHTSNLGHDAFDNLRPNSKDKWPGTPVVNWDGNKYTRVAPNITKEQDGYNLNGTVTEPGIHNHIKYLDYQVWLYLEKLKEMGIENDTILIFAADNGTSGYGKHSHIKQEGTHVPLIIYAPGVKMTKQGKQTALASMADILPTLSDIMGEPIPDDYEIHGKSLWPFLTTDAQEHRDWVYAYKKDLTLIRGHKVMKDGNNDWWDVSTTPSDLTSFKKITDWGAVSPEHKQERDTLKSVIPKFDIYATEHDPIINVN